MRLFGMALIAVLSGTVLAGIAAEPVGPSAPDASKTGSVRVYQGIIRTIDLDKRTVQVRVWFSRRTFEVPADCAIQSRKKTDARLEDLKRGDDVEVAYENHDGQWLASRIAIRGVTRVDRQEAREKDQLNQILTPTPSERGIN